jgi:hypothetical protein
MVQGRKTRPGECSGCGKEKELVAQRRCGACYQRHWRSRKASRGGRSANVCRAHRQLKPCQGCAKISVAQRARWQDPARRQRSLAALGRRESSWLDDEKELVRSLAGSNAAVDITERINQLRAKLGLPLRTVGAVRVWAEVNKIDLWREPHAVNEVISLFGTTWNTVQAWRRAGYLKGSAWGKFWVFTTEELEAFVRSYPWLFDPEKMAPGPLKDLALLVSRRDPWIRAGVIAKRIPCKVDTMLGFIRRGEVEAHQRTGHNGAYMVRASAEREVRQLLIARREQSTARLIAIRHPNSKVESGVAA